MKEIEATTPWGKAIQKLKGSRSIRSLETDGIISQKGYRQLLGGVLGPGVETLDHFLKSIGKTWYDWAKVYEAEKRAEATRPSKIVKNKASPRAKKVVHQEAS